MKYVYLQTGSYVCKDGVVSPLIGQWKATLGCTSPIHTSVLVWEAILNAIKCADDPHVTLTFEPSVGKAKGFNLTTVGVKAEAILEYLECEKRLWKYRDSAEGPKDWYELGYRCALEGVCLHPNPLIALRGANCTTDQLSRYLEKELLGAFFIQESGWCSVKNDSVTPSKHMWHARIAGSPSCCKFSDSYADYAAKSLFSEFPETKEFTLELAFFSGRILFDFDKVRNAAIKSIVSGNSLDFELTGECVEI